MTRILDLGAWDLPVDQISDVATIMGPDGHGYLVLEVKSSPDLAIFSDPDQDLVLRVMGYLGDAVYDGCAPKIVLADMIRRARAGIPEVILE